MSDFVDYANRRIAALEADVARLAMLVCNMRDAQARYFKSRTPADLAEAKRLEKAVDEAVAAILTPDLPRQGDLFAGEHPGPYRGRK